MGNKRRNRRSKRVKSHTSDREENTSETRFKNSSVSQNVDNIFDRNSGSELIEPLQIGNGTEGFSQRLIERNNTKMSQIEEHLKSKSEGILTDTRSNKNRSSKSREYAENCRPDPSNSESYFLRRTHASNIEIDKDESQDNHCQFSDTNVLRQPATPLGVVNETLDDTIIINGDKPKVDYHVVTGSPRLS